MSTSTDGASTTSVVAAKWTLHVEFDPPGSGIEGWDETVMFMMRVARSFGGLWEELREIMVHEIGTTKVEVTVDTLEWLSSLMEWVSYHTIPREMRLTRNGERTS